MKKRTKPSKNLAKKAQSGTPKALAQGELETQDGINLLLPEVYPKPNELTNDKASKKLKKWSEKDSRNHFMTPLWLTVFLKFIYPIELDAASSEEVNTLHGFERFFSKMDDALSQEWKVEEGHGIFINPPYCGKQNIYKWAEKISEQHEIHNHLIFALVPARSTETRWFQLLLKHASHVVFLKKRLIHNELISQTAANFPSALVVFGGQEIEEKLDSLSLLGEVLETENFRKSKKS